jgi:LytS/YehU family sensor histidine kinase
MSRRVVWLQLLIGWLPVWALVMTLMFVAHPQIGARNAALGSLRMIAAAALLGLVVQRFVERHPWPARVAPGFVAMHLVAATVYSISWLMLSSSFASVVQGALVLAVGPSVHATLVMGIWLYVMIAGVSYTTQTTERAARAEANAAKAQLAALRSQINPHFLFNAMHTVVQLIPREPKQAAQAAEQLATLLRTAIEEDRDVVSVAEELAFVEKYLELERIRFGDRLRVRVEVSREASAATIPSFAAQTLVENAVRHAAAPRVEPTDLTIAGRVSNGSLTLTVRDTGSGATEAALTNGNGTGLRRLRERLAVLYDGRARLNIDSRTDGLVASLVIPQDQAD